MLDTIIGLELQMGLASMIKWNKKICFLAANTQDGFGEHWAYISAGGPGHLV